eukprot:198619-Amphidinium_carterae.1
MLMTVYHAMYVCLSQRKRRSVQSGAHKCTPYASDQTSLLPGMCSPFHSSVITFTSQLTPAFIVYTSLELCALESKEKHFSRRSAEPAQANPCH